MDLSSVPDSFQTDCEEQKSKLKTRVILRFLKSTLSTSIQDKTKVTRGKIIKKEKLNTSGKRPKLEEGGKETEVYMEGS